MNKKKEFQIETLGKRFSSTLPENTKNQPKNSIPKTRRFGEVDFDELKTLNDKYNPSQKRVGELDAEEITRAQTLLKIIDDVAQSQGLPFPSLDEEICDSLYAISIFHGENADPFKAKEWLENNRDSLTVEKIALLIQVSMFYGVAWEGAENQKKSVAARRKKPTNIKSLVLKEEDEIRKARPRLSKNQIRQEIVKKYPELNHDTVRKYLATPREGQAEE